MTFDLDPNFRYFIGSGVCIRIRTPAPDHILLGGYMRSPTALVLYINCMLSYISEHEQSETAYVRQGDGLNPESASGLRMQSGKSGQIFMKIRSFSPEI